MSDTGKSDAPSMDEIHDSMRRVLAEDSGAPPSPPTATQQGLPTSAAPALTTPQEIAPQANERPPTFGRGFSRRPPPLVPGDAPAVAASTPIPASTQPTATLEQQARAAISAATASTVRSWLDANFARFVELQLSTLVRERVHQTVATTLSQQIEPALSKQIAAAEERLAGAMTQQVAAAINQHVWPAVSEQVTAAEERLAGAMTQQVAAAVNRHVGPAVSEQVTAAEERLAGAMTQQVAAAVNRHVGPAVSEQVTAAEERLAG